MTVCAETWGSETTKRRTKGDTEQNEVTYNNFTHYSEQEGNKWMSCCNSSILNQALQRLNWRKQTCNLASRNYIIDDVTDELMRRGGGEGQKGRWSAWDVNSMCEGKERGERNAPHPPNTHSYPPPTHTQPSSPTYRKYAKKQQHNFSLTTQER